MNYIYSIFLILAAAVAVAQSPLPDAELPKDFRPSGLKLSYDVIPLGESIFTVRTSNHFQAAIDFHNYFLVAEYGRGSITRGTDSTYSYANEGWYWRAGPEVNFLKNDRKGNSITFGLRFARSYFSDELAFQHADSPFGEVSVSQQNPDMIATWGEITTGLNVNIWKGLYMGYTIRYKFLRQIKGNDNYNPYDIPGWGQYRNESAAGFSYFIGWVIPLREKYPEVVDEQ